MRIVILCAAFICAAGFGHAIAGWPAGPGTVLCDSVAECEARILAGEKRLRELKILDAVIVVRRGGECGAMIEVEGKIPEADLQKTIHSMKSAWNHSKAHGRMVSGHAFYGCNYGL